MTDGTYLWARCCFVATCEHAGEHYENVFLLVTYRTTSTGSKIATDALQLIAGGRKISGPLKYGGFMALQVQSALKSAEGA